MLKTLIFWALAVSALEVDNYQAMDSILSDSSSLINNHINKIMKEVFMRRQLFRRRCSTKVIRLGARLGRMVEQDTRGFIERTSAVDKIPRDGQRNHHNSIYKKSSRLKNLGHTINVGGFYLGSDKISHMFGFGFLYYMKYLKDYALLKLRYSPLKAHKLALQKVLDYGVTSERTWVGYGISGVLSYADLEANYAGFKFYYNLCHGQNPVLSPQGKNWIPTKDFDIADYVTPYFDESFHISGFKDNLWQIVRPELEKKCELKNSPVFQERIKFYKSFKGETPSLRYSRKLVRDKILPDPQNYSLEKVCKK